MKYIIVLFACMAFTAQAAPAEAPHEPSPTGMTLILLERIIIPNIDFTQVSLGDTFDFLSAQAKALDPDGRGIKFVFESKGFDPDFAYDLKVQDIPLEDLLEIYTRIANIHYIIDGEKVIIKKANKSV